MIPKNGMNLEYLKAAFRRRFWYVVLPFFLVSIGAVVYCIKTPKIYRSNAVILIKPQEVPKDYIKPTVTSNIQSRLNTIREEIMSRSRLAEVIEQLDIYPEIRATGSIQDAVDVMRSKITIVPRRDKDDDLRKQEPTSFAVSFEGKDPLKTRDVTAAIARLLIDQNYRLREEQATGTTKFLDRELVRMKDALREKEEAVREFKEKNFGFLPDQMQNNFNILNRLQQHLEATDAALQQTEDRKVLLQTQLNKLDALASSEQGTNLENLRKELRTLESRYSNKHPDVMRLKATIVKLEKDLSPEIEGNKAEDSSVSRSTNETQRLVNLQKEDLSAELRMIDSDIRSLRKQIEQTTAKIDEYQRRIETGPKIEQMFRDLRRDYDRANENYQSLLQKKLEAELAENLERTQKGEQFQILDQASLPRKPFKPNILKILTMGFMLAVTLGSGLAFMREYTDSTFWSAKEVESIIELPVLISVPVTQTDRERRRKSIKRLAAVCTLLAMSSTLLYALFELWKRNKELLPL